ncbi:MAG TPA: DUF2939 domain-containing protein [Xanthomonadaceae bacterium]|nr:DUF2939 domain-containing protein [Xanthomonadaceae bacterium]
MKKWIVPVVMLAVLLAGYVVAGPYLTFRAIRSAVQTQDASALSDQVDFPALRASLKAQLSDRLVRAVGIDGQSGMLGAIGLTVAGGLVNGAVETMVTPVGLGALMEGRKIWNRIGDGIAHPDVADPSTVAGERPQPLQRAEYRYESTSRFTATVRDDQGRPIVFVMTRNGLRWKLSDIRLPL